MCYSAILQNCNWCGWTQPNRTFSYSLFVPSAMHEWKFWTFNFDTDSVHIILNNTVFHKFWTVQASKIISASCGRVTSSVFPTIGTPPGTLYLVQKPAQTFLVQSVGPIPVGTIKPRSHRLANTHLAECFGLTLLLNNSKEKCVPYTS